MIGESKKTTWLLEITKISNNTDKMLDTSEYLGSSSAETNRY